MKRIGGLSILILMISVLLPYHSTADAAEQKNVNGVYQVELSFQSDESAGQEILFGDKAELTVREGRYILSVPVKYQDVIKKVTVQQSGNQMKSSLNADENLVQFDMENVLASVMIEGEYQWSEDDLLLSFSQEIVILADSLPKEEQKPAADGTVLTDGNKQLPVKTESVHRDKTPIIKEREKRTYTPRPSRHSKEAAEAREKKQAAETARKAATEEEQLVFDRTQDAAAKVQSAVKEQTPVRPAVVQIAGEKAEVASTSVHTAEGQAIPFNVVKACILFLACILSGALLIRRLVSRKKEVISK
ncbi:MULTISPECIES: hypothetical protein [unclassified Sporosarcina]|uniref:hypothetical protein n=1 Tax=unclassified Sporosarcina TaxID=2647733 RepID=UPI00203DE107|nr:MULTISPECIES: hypothetical protein [unclassified Sporosarcina]GKV64072.1 hypothetical protein NCCP2331_02250 [Sporosarcina sp. NCCP-2331]GLB56353.1 hypothetical protein NCCP2378_21400 [Sporosarcina sp. NCCP-2378]